MTVRDLTILLQRCPQDWNVVQLDGESGLYFEIAEVNRIVYTDRDPKDGRKKIQVKAIEIQ